MSNGDLNWSAYFIWGIAAHPRGYRNGGAAANKRRRYWQTAPADWRDRPELRVRRYLQGPEWTPDKTVVEEVAFINLRVQRLG